MSLTKEQVTELTERINERLAEFGDMMFDATSRGIVRLVYDVIDEWHTEQAAAAPRLPRSLADVGEAGVLGGSYQRLDLSPAQDEAITLRVEGGGPGGANLVAVVDPQVFREAAASAIAEFDSNGASLPPSEMPDHLPGDPVDDDGDSWREAAEELVGKEALETFGIDDAADELPATSAAKPSPVGPLKRDEKLTSDDPPALPPATAATLGPEHTLSPLPASSQSGAAARPMHPDWARSLCDQCQAAGVPFFFKQWGEYIPANHEGLNGERWYNSGAPTRVGDGYLYMIRAGKKNAGRVLDGQEWSEFPAMLPSPSDRGELMAAARAVAARSGMTAEQAVQELLEGAVRNKARRDELYVELEAAWPDLPDLPDGVDRFAQYPVVGTDE